MTLLGFLFSVGLAVGPSAIYFEQAYRIKQRRNSEGFSRDVCAVLLISNIARIVWWFSVHYELALLVQSILMIGAQLGLLYLCLYYRPGSFASSVFSISSTDQNGDVIFDSAPGTGLPTSSSSAAGQTSVTAPPAHPPFQVIVDPPPEEQGDEVGHHAPSHIPGEADDLSNRSSRRSVGSAGLPSLSVNSLAVPHITDSNRPFGFWTWPDFASYIWTLLIFVAILGILQILLGWSSKYVSLLGFFALGLESMLPVPQLLQNHERKSLAGFQLTVLAGWTGGDLVKSIYYASSGAPIQFLIFGIFQLSIDLLICAQAYTYREKTASDSEAMREADARTANPTAPSPPVARSAPARPKVNGAAATASASTPAAGASASTAPLPHATSPSSTPFSVGDEIEADDA